MATYNLEELLPQSTPLPYFKPDDVIKFPDERTLNPQARVLQLSDLLFQDIFQDLIKIDPVYDKVKDHLSDKERMKERLLGEGLVTGLSLIDYKFADKGSLSLVNGDKLYESYGWLGKISVVQSLPGIIEPVSAYFDFISTIFRPTRASKNGEQTLMNPVLRTGPYNANTGEIGGVSNPQLEELRKRSRSIAPSSMAPGINSTTPRPSGKDE